MLQYPETQRKARAEIDAVIGLDRLPRISDKVSLPYVRSLLTEVLRLHPSGPFGKSQYSFCNRQKMFKQGAGAPHALSVDYTYEGFHLPRGTILMSNFWCALINSTTNLLQNFAQVEHPSLYRSMLHDPEVYQNPMEFIPERYNNSDAEMKKVAELNFGLGRRACPGSSFAEDTLYAMITTVLSTCEILPPLDKSGKPVIPDVAFTTNGTFL